MDHIITAMDVAKRDSQRTVRDWIRVTSIQLKMKGACPVVFSGNMGAGKAYAYISNGRWLAVCDEPGCAGCEYVDPQEPVFFCLTCGNGGSGNGKQVIFPKDHERIEQALLERVMVPVGGNEPVTKTFNARPLKQSLRRDWMPSQLKEIHHVNPSLHQRVIVDTYGETADMIRKKTREMEADHASTL